MRYRLYFGKKLRTFFEIAFPLVFILSLFFIKELNSDLSESKARETTLYSMIVEVFEDYCKQYNGVVPVNNIEWGPLMVEFEDAIVLGCKENNESGWLVYTENELVYIGELE